MYFPTRFTLSVLLLVGSAYCEVQGAVCCCWQRWWGPCCYTISTGVEQALACILQGKLTYHLFHQLLSNQRDVGITANVHVCQDKPSLHWFIEFFLFYFELLKTWALYICYHHDELNLGSICWPFLWNTAWRNLCADWWLSEMVGAWQVE